MVVAKAYQSVDMGPESTSYLPPDSLSAFVAGSTTQIDFLDPLGRLQRYFGAFNPVDLALQKFDTSTFTGYQQYTGGSANPADLMYEVSGASINGQVIADFIAAGNGYGLVADLFKGADQITGSEQEDVLIGFRGADAVRGLAGADALFGDKGNDFVNGNEGNDTVRGGAGNDTVRGGQGDDVVTGNAGADDLYGDDGDDFVNGNEGSDVVRGGVGNDTVRGGQGDDFVTGNAGDDHLFGDLGDDDLRGGAGSDRLTGNSGNDTLSGGLDADVFVLSKDFDVILDFDAAEGDTIEILASTPYTLGSTGPAGSGDLRIIRDVGTTTLLGVSLADFDAATSIVVIPDPVV